MKTSASSIGISTVILLLSEHLYGKHSHTAYYRFYLNCFAGNMCHRRLFWFCAQFGTHVSACLKPPHIRVTLRLLASHA